MPVGAVLLSFFEAIASRPSFLFSYLRVVYKTPDEPLLGVGGWVRKAEL